MSARRPQELVEGILAERRRRRPGLGTGLTAFLRVCRPAAGLPRPGRRRGLRRVLATRPTRARALRGLLMLATALGLARLGFNGFQVCLRDSHGFSPG